MRSDFIALTAAIACAGGAGIVRGDVIEVPQDHQRIQLAIVAAADGDRIHVAPGTYHELIDLLRKRIHVVGTGGADHTFIDGTGLGGSVIQCVRGEGPDTIIEGFTVMGGGGSFGGGLRCAASSPTIIGCVFNANVVPRFGGAVHCSGDARPEFRDCRFVKNVADSGGAVYSGAGAAPLITGTLFAGNFAAYGGAVCGVASALEIRDCTFEDNGAFGRGGALYDEGGRPAIVGCAFRGNWSRVGGGVYGTAASEALVVSCAFRRNSAFAGGAVASVGGCRPEIVGCVFARNTAVWGGAILNADASPALVLNCTLSGNGVRWGRGAAVLNDASDARIVNSILWGDRGDEIADENGAASLVTHSDVQGGWPGAGNLDADPRFVSASTADYRLDEGSPCVDAGDHACLPCDVLDLDGDGDCREPLPVDIDGLARCVRCTERTGASAACGIVDLGACERQVRAASPRPRS